MRYIAASVLAVITACSGVSQGEYDDLRARYDAARDQLASVEVEGAALVAAETAVAAYVSATDPFDLEALADVYADDVVLFDATRGITFRARATALADLGSGIASFGMIGQRTLSQTVSADSAVIEWETRGMTDNGLDWSFRGVSILELENGVVTRETLYYDSTEAPWSG